ncbi:MAG: DUF4424 family protein [Spirochaetaceae bacterium]|nr:DUF4424 family protein [Spirochaetaceae bacterium]
MKKLSLIIFALVCALFSVFADDGHGYVNPTLGGFVIQNSTAIEMTDEVVEIWEDHVKVTFHFTNLTDEPQKVTVGFPVKWEERSGVGSHGEDQPIDDTPELRAKIEDFYKFKSTCNGKVLARKLIANARKNPGEYEDKCDFWFVTELTFAPKQVLEVIDEYNHGPRSIDDSIGYFENIFEYILTTGSSWANVIKSAEIIFHSKNIYLWPLNAKSFKNIEPTILNLENLCLEGISCSYPPASIFYDTKKDEVKVIWELKNIKPKENWKVVFNGYCRGDFPINWITPFLLKDDPVLDNLYNHRFLYLDEHRKYFEMTPYDDLVKTFSKEDFKAEIIEIYERSFVRIQKKTEISKIYAQYLINSIYALHNYKFKNKKWADMFSQFSWYKPEISSISEKDFSAEENVIIKRLQEFR